MAAGLDPLGDDQIAARVRPGPSAWLATGPIGACWIGTVGATRAVMAVLIVFGTG